MVSVLHTNLISCRVGFVLSFLARATLVVLCRDENGTAVLSTAALLKQG